MSDSLATLIRLNRWRLDEERRRLAELQRTWDEARNELAELDAEADRERQNAADDEVG